MNQLFTNHRIKGNLSIPTITIRVKLKLDWKGSCVTPWLGPPLKTVRIKQIKLTKNEFACFPKIDQTLDGGFPCFMDAKRPSWIEEINFFNVYPNWSKCYLISEILFSWLSRAHILEHFGLVIWSPFYDRLSWARFFPNLILCPAFWCIPDQFFYISAQYAYLKMSIFQ